MSRKKNDFIGVVVWGLLFTIVGVGLTYALMHASPLP